MKKTIFWVWDYYPPKHPDPIITIMRWIYWQFDKLSNHSNKVVYLNTRLENLRKKLGIIPTDLYHLIVPIGTDPIRRQFHHLKLGFIKIGFIGVLKKSQGLDLFFEQTKLLQQRFPQVSLEVIGSGPDEQYFRKLAEQCGIATNFHNLLSEQVPHEAKKIIKILKNCDIGLATYIPEESNVSYYGDPSKVKKYLSCGLPVITTDVYEFSSVIKNNRAGLVIDYYHPNSLINAITKISKHYQIYQKNAQTLAKKYYYKNIYTNLFNI